MFYSVGYQVATGGNAASGIDNVATGSTVVGTFLCPSDNQRGTVNNQQLGSSTYATTNYKACAGSNWAGSSIGGLAATSGTRGRNSTTSFPTYATDGVDHGNGVICRGGGTSTTIGAMGAPIMTTMMDIRDGASKTFLAGESLPGNCGWSLWFWFEGTTATCGIPLNFRPGGNPPTSTDWQDNFGFMSRHPRGANFLMCDGSVHFINDMMCGDTTVYPTAGGTGMAIYMGLATIDGNEPVSVPDNWPPTL